MEKNRFFIPRSDKKLGDRYELLECLGDGSFGWVWRAQRLHDDQIVALKIPKEQGASNERLAEGKSLIGRNHPNVVEVYWMGRVPPEREWYVIEMEYFPGVTLAHYLDHSPHGYVESYRRVLSLYEQVLQGVAYLHETGLAHCDIKPQNILISGEVVKLTDFGSSVLPEDLYCRTRENGGTILYSAPEVAGIVPNGAEDNDLYKADIYSLGVLLYHLLTTRLPHDTLSQVARHTPFPRPREVNSTVCPALEDFVLRCLAFYPEDRWTSVESMVASFPGVKHAQLEYQPIIPIPGRTNAQEDWSSLTVRLLEKGEYGQAVRVALAEYDTTGDMMALLFAFRALKRSERFFDSIYLYDEHPEIFTAGEAVKREVGQIILDAYLSTRQIDSAHRIIDTVIESNGENPDLLLKKASILGLQARYQEASEILLLLNRKFPRNPAILKRLSLVFEQMRDTGRAAMFLKAYCREVADDAWAKAKIEQYKALATR